MNIVICDYIEQYCKEIDKIIWNMADEFEEHINVVSFNSVQELYKYLKNNKVQNVNHPYTELLPYALENKIHILILQVTQNCNLRCDYCLYSGKYNTYQLQTEHQNYSALNN